MIVRHRTVPLFALLLLLVPAVSTPVRAAGSPTWLPAAVEESAAEQLAGRFGVLRRGAAKEKENREEAVLFTRALRDVVEGWGVDGVLERAPDFPGLTLPPLRDRYLDAMQRYTVCNLLLFRQTEHADFAEDFNARFTGTVGLSGLTFAMVRLREPFVAAGGSNEQIERAMTRAELEPVFDRLQSDEAARNAAEAACQPVVVELLEQPLREFSARHP